MNSVKANPKTKQQKKYQRAEHSLAMRFVSGVMTLVCLGAACGYTHTHPLILFFSVWLAFAGSYLSYFLRKRHNILITVIMIIGVLILLGMFAQEMVSQFNNTRVDIFIPFIHVLSGLLVLQTFELRSRADLELNALIGLGLLMCTMVIGRDLTSGLVVLAYLALSAAFLYFDTVSRTLEKGRNAPTEANPSSREADADGDEDDDDEQRNSTSAILSVSMLPLLAAVLFFLLPRMNSVFDYMSDQIQMIGEEVARGGSNSYASSRPNGPIVARAVGGRRKGTKKHGVGGKNIHVVKDASEADSVVGEAVDGKHGSGMIGGQASVVGGGKGKKNGVGLGKADEKGKDAPTLSKNGKPEKEVNDLGDVKDPKNLKLSKNSKETKNSKDSKDSKTAANSKDKKNADTPVDNGPPEDQLVMRDEDSADGDDRLLLEVSAPGDFFYKRIVLDKYDGHKWTISSSGSIANCKSATNSDYKELGGVPSLFMPPNMPTTSVTTKITVQANLGHLIPAVESPQKIRFPKQSVLVDDNGVLKSDDILKPGTEYEVVSQVPNYNIPDLRRRSESDEDEKKARVLWKNCIQLPVNLPGEVTTLARTVAGANGNWFVKAERICNYLRTNYKYSLDGDPPATSKQDLVDTFLFNDKKRAACGPFASAFAVMCRVNGIPTRMIGGYAPGVLNAGTNIREIFGRHGHAWAEIFVPSVGWVPFDATPAGTLPAPLEQDSSALASMARSLAQLQATLNPAHTNASNIPISAPVNSVSPSPISKASDAQTPDPSGKDKKNVIEQNNAKPPTINPTSDLRELLKSSLGWLLRGLIVVGSIPLTFLIAQVLRETYLKMKNRRAKVPVRRSTVIYLKVVNDMKKFKVSRLPSDTADELTGRYLTALEAAPLVPPELPGALSEFMRAYSDDRFGLQPEDDGDTSVRTKQLEELSERIHMLTRRTGI